MLHIRAAQNWKRKKKKKRNCNSFSSCHIFIYMTNLHVPIMVFVCICVIFLLLVPEKILQNITKYYDDDIRCTIRPFSFSSL